ncbi:BAH_G0022360.mRNA.1.CDS.1 [Saccharomyces cerevisiae]|nr:SX2_G0041230.mRNA.1.CDS.1 [Saccharomyces cerevisiae]CAI4517936.1 BAG_1a_G0022490.mRNA.1.CDS.1 [Saccharomyces cerevisiae]CAI4518963.1 BAH_G0022360.mRNA.1.CDS.1 [Saccharomyces cerevisiae]CAI7148300.1 BAG_1a_G0022490.mRNA.1.CDS.1 [Saccharomyces cerevisiae]CAI7148922.1 BAH_G0022360.mRNA.1.CDS.1 [Saccharomyces cerevisiae]
MLLDVESVDNSCHFIQRHNLSRSGDKKSVKDFKALTFLSRGHDAPFPWNDNELNAEFSNVVKLWIKKKKKKE